MTLSVGVVGCGGISRYHFSALEKADADVRWVCDLSDEAAAPWADRFAAKRTCEYMDVMRDPDTKVVDVTTFSSAHREICLAAIQAGKAVICEKTLTENADESLEVVRAAIDAGVPLFTSYMKRFLPAIRRAKKLLPQIGRILSTHARTHQPWGDLWGRTPSEGFFHTPTDGTSAVRRNYGGGILVCGGSHILDLLCFFLGRPRTVCGHVHVPEGRDYDLLTAALMQTDNGVAHFEALAHPYTHTGFLRDGWDERIEILGTEGKLEILSPLWTDVETKGSRLLHYDNHTGTTTEHDFPPCSPFDAAIAQFLEWIDQGSKGEQPAKTGYDVDELIAHIQTSATSGRILSIDWRI